MLAAAEGLEFERAAALRDKILVDRQRIGETIEDVQDDDQTDRTSDGNANVPRRPPEDAFPAKKEIAVHVPLARRYPPRTFPWVTYTIIGLCTLAFLMQSLAGPEGDRIVETWGMIPVRVLTRVSREASILVERPSIVQTQFGPKIVDEVKPLPPAGVSDWVTLVTCMFLHGGTDAFSRQHVVPPYLWRQCGRSIRTSPLCHPLSLYWSDRWASPFGNQSGSPIPTVGASGAIAGVMGAYILLYPKAVVETIIPLPCSLFPLPFGSCLSRYLVFDAAIYGASADGDQWRRCLVGSYRRVRCRDGGRCVHDGNTHRKSACYPSIE